MYELRWMQGTADFLGFEHQRRRFFIVGRRRDVDLVAMLGRLPLAPLRDLLPDWAAEPRRVVAKADDRFKERMHVMGNAVVPACSYFAFCKLAGLPVAPPERRARRSFVVDPKAYKPPRGTTKGPALKEAGLLRAPTTLRLIPTPRAGNTGANNFLTERSMRDLCTFVRFERDTPDALRAKKPNMAWVEFLMGYRPGYTLLE